MMTRQKPAIHVSIIGFGDIGQRITQQLLSVYPPSELSVCTYKRNLAEPSEIKGKLQPATMSIGHKLLDLDNPATIDGTVFKNHHLFYLAPPPPKGTVDTRMQHWLAALDKQHLPRRILYISTTGVYGDQQGQTVTEQTPVNPQADRAKRRLNAEQALAHFATDNNIDYIILRVAGIYGETRLPVKRLKQQIPILKPELAPMTNRIHQDDLAKICIAAMFNANSSEIYNVSDGDKINMSDYFIQVANFLHLPTPPEINWLQAEQQLSKGMMSYLKESRLIDSKKVLMDLKISLTYPSISTFFSLYSDTNKK